MLLARRLASGPRIALTLMKQNFNLAENCTLAQVLDLEAWHQVESGRTQDHKEAARAFVEKRKPIFIGRLQASEGRERRDLHPGGSSLAEIVVNPGLKSDHDHPPLQQHVATASTENEQSLEVWRCSLRVKSAGNRDVCSVSV
jgi:hypothetical protein